MDGWRVYSGMNTEVMAISNVWVRNCMKGFLVKKYFENKWSLKARDPKLMVCTLCLQFFFETLGILGRGSRLFFLKLCLFSAIFLVPFSVTNGLLFIGKTLCFFLNVKWRQYHALDADLLLKQVPKRLW